VPKRTVAGRPGEVNARNVSSFIFSIARALSISVRPYGVSSTGPPFDRATRVCPTRASSFCTLECDRRLRSSDPLRRLRETRLLSDENERAQQFQVEGGT